MLNNYQMIIGLEVHVQLKSFEKLFSMTPTMYGAMPNTQVSYYDLSLPGTLPILNYEAIEMAIKFGLAINAKINNKTLFYRKNYFYPDLSKGYQISQYAQPIIEDGCIDIITNTGQKKTITIQRAHLEEDAGKSCHNFIGNKSAIDYNRSGIPLLEIITAPDFHNKEEVINYLKTLHLLVQHLNISTGNMKEGSFRCDVNLSLTKEEHTLGKRVEIKNLNSFKFIEKAIDYEYKRQLLLLNNNKNICQETRLYDEKHNKTTKMRMKENDIDYRYLPDPDLLPIYISNESIDDIRNKLPILPNNRRIKYKKEGLNNEEIEFLMNNILIANYYDELNKKINNSKQSYYWIIELKSLFKSHNCLFNTKKISINTILNIIKYLNKEIITLSSAKAILFHYFNKPNDIKTIIEELKLYKINNKKFIENIISNVIKNYSSQVIEYKLGNKKVFGFLMGKIMNLSNKKADPIMTKEILIKKLYETS